MLGNQLGTRDVSKARPPLALVTPKVAGEVAVNCGVVPLAMEDVAQQKMLPNKRQQLGKPTSED